MAFQLTLTPRFEKNFKALTAQERKQVQNKLRLLAENPLHPSLRVKRIQGSAGLFECCEAGFEGWKHPHESGKQRQ